MSWDSSVMQAIADHRTAWATALANGVMEVGTSPAGEIALVIIAAVLVVWFRAFRPALAAVLALLIAGVSAVVLKHLFDRPRPPAHLALVSAGGQSFPSTHAAATAAVAVAFVVACPWGSARARRIAGACSGALVVVVGVCMVYLGAHWLSDVLVGWLLGGAIGYLVGRAFREQPPVARPRQAPTALSGGRPGRPHVP